VGTPDVAENKINNSFYSVSIDGKRVKALENINGLLADKNISPDGTYLLSDESVKVAKVLGKDNYEGTEKSNVYIYDQLDYRHWDTWNDGTFNHVILTNKKTQEKIDLFSATSGVPTL